jgi:hypothetical protein
MSYNCTRQLVWVDPMRFVVQQLDNGWAVVADGRELARFDSQQRALADIAARLEAAPDPQEPAALSLRYVSSKPSDA